MIRTVGARLAAAALAVAALFTASAASARDLERADLEVWLDGMMPYALANGDIAGAVVVVVKDGQILLQKGYGFSDVARRTPMDPARTVIRPGSVSKLFTWTAVMQQVEQGKIDLDRDVQAYVDFKLPPGPGRPVTMRDLMTHTGGFEDTAKAAIADDPKKLLPLRAYLLTSAPRRIFPPGEVPSYSNYGTALAGYIVTRVSGQDFDAYLDQHVLAPLGMTSSSSRQPLPANLRSRVSQGYDLGSEAPKPYELFGCAPAGSLAATAEDMGRFMIAELREGAGVLKPETARLMQGSARTVIPGLNRMLLGFYEDPRNGRRVIGHSGDTLWFHSALRLFPDDGVGLFVSMNSAGRDGATDAVREGLFRGFADRYFPAAPAPFPAVDAAAAERDARAVAGLYMSSRRTQTNIFHVLDLFAQTRLEAGRGGTLTSVKLTGPGGAPILWRPTGPLSWRDAGGQDRLAAKVEDGRVVLLGAGENSPYSVFQPVPWPQSSAWLVPALAAALGVLVLTFARWPVVAVQRRRTRAAASAAPRLYADVPLASLAVLAACGAYAATLVGLGERYTLMTSSLDGWIWALQIAALLAFVGGALTGLRGAWRAWTNKRSWFARGWSVAVALSFLVLLWIGVVFHMFPFTTRY